MSIDLNSCKYNNALDTLNMVDLNSCKYNNALDTLNMGTCLGLEALPELPHNHQKLQQCLPQEIPKIQPRKP